MCHSQTLRKARIKASFSPLLLRVQGCGWHLAKLLQQENKNWMAEGSVQPVKRAC